MSAIEKLDKVLDEKVMVANGKVLEPYITMMSGIADTCKQAGATFKEAATKQKWDDKTMAFATRQLLSAFEEALHLFDMDDEVKLDKLDAKLFKMIKG